MKVFSRGLNRVCMHRMMQDPATAMEEDAPVLPETATAAAGPASEAAAAAAHASKRPRTGGSGAPVQPGLERGDEVAGTDPAEDAEAVVAAAGDESMAGDEDADDEENGQEDELPVALALAAAPDG